MVRSLSLCAVGLAAAFWLGGCAAPAPVPPPNVPPPVSAAPATAPPPVGSASVWTWSSRLDAAAQRLRDHLGGGAEVAQTTDQRLWISLPNSETFPLGRSAVTKPAGAWLDQVAQALRSIPQAEVQIVGQPDPREGGNTALGLDRAQSARDWMVMRGVPARRVAVSTQGARGKTKPAENRLDILIGERGAAAARN